MKGLDSMTCRSLPALMFPRRVRPSVPLQPSRICPSPPGGGDCCQLPAQGLGAPSSCPLVTKDKEIRPAQLSAL